MVEQHGAYLVELVLPAFISLGLEAYQALDLQLHGRERVLDFVGDLPRHSAPGLVTLRLGELAAALGEFRHHPVVCAHKAGNLVLVLVMYVFQVTEACGIHLGTHLHQRLEHQFQEAGGHVHRHQQQEYEQRNDGQGVADDIGLEVVAVVGVGSADDGRYRTVVAQQRGVHAIEGPIAYLFLVDEVAAGIADYGIIRLGIHPRIHLHLVEHIRGGRHQHHSGRVV